jgi:hypothetical protein
MVGASVNRGLHIRLQLQENPVTHSKLALGTALVGLRLHALLHTKQMLPD